MPVCYIRVLVVEVKLVAISAVLVHAQISDKDLQLMERIVAE